MKTSETLMRAVAVDMKTSEMMGSAPARSVTWRLCGAGMQIADLQRATSMKNVNDGE